MEEACGSIIRNSGRGDVLRARAIRLASDACNMVRLSQFKILKETGQSGLGRELVAELEGTGIHYAIKIMDKQLLASQDKLKSAKNEQEILRMVDHPFVQPLYCYFETETSLYAVTDYCPGGTNLGTIREMNPGNHLSEDTARFYAAEVLITLEYLHQLVGVVYRDLKPENIFIKANGHIMMVDFSSAVLCTLNPYLLLDSSPSSNNLGAYKFFKCLPFSPANICKRIFGRKSQAQSRRKSFPVFVAEPRDEGDQLIGSAMDLWTFGVFLYELLFGQMPFDMGHDDCRYSHYNAEKDSLSFPNSPVVSEEAKDLMKTLLDPCEK
ncbi:hypothetical protein KI387_029473, partial [Taxus chinensis]